MVQVIARYPVLFNCRALSFAAAVALAVVTFAATGDPAAAGLHILGRGGHR